MKDPSPSTRTKRPFLAIPEDLHQRIRIEKVLPSVEDGRFPVKRVVGEEVRVRAVVVTHGHDRLRVRLHHRANETGSWSQVPMDELGNDLWEATCSVRELGSHEYFVEAWVDRFGTWQRELDKKHEAGQDVSSELREGAEMVRRAAEAASGADREWLLERAERLAEEEVAVFVRVEAGLSEELTASMLRYAEREGIVRSEPTLRVTVERERARVGAWYEMFPRSAGTTEGRSATFREAERSLAGIAAMGFDVVYLPPIHPIGTTHRKGPNNTLEAKPGDSGSPWAIGSPEGGHKAVEPGLGTLEDFDRFVAEARRLGLEIALDIAFQCSPDHPYVREHPEWFRHRPDGSIKYAENPPKKYQDIYPLDFECEAWRELWRELNDVVAFWCDRGVRIFRVDNPHTKSFGFWEWLIDRIRRSYPDAVFLAEAFTRPHILKHLAKCGFSQSYTYFTWRNTKAELTDYLTELTRTETREYLRPNLFANTPDILHEYLQTGGRPAFQVRLVLAATMGASYGIYGPPFELCVTAAVPGTEEYLDSEKYQIRVWDWDRPGHIKAYITRVNRIRRENPSLHHDWSLRFHATDNDRIICYSKSTPDGSNVILVVVNLDPHHTHSAWLDLDLDALGVGEGQSRSYQVHDLLGGARYLWDGPRSFVRLDPNESPAHVFRVRRKVRTERDFDYYL